MTECYKMSCYDCIHCDRCSDFESGFSAHCADVSKCKHFRNKADFVEVVRCKDCKYFIGEHKNGQGICCCGIKDTNYNAEFYPYADDFCNYGERREE